MLRIAKDHPSGKEFIYNENERFDEEKVCGVISVTCRREARAV